MKDAWYTAYKNFLHLAYLLTFIDLVVIYLYFTGTEGMNLTTIAFLLVATLIWYGLAYLFKTRHHKAISFGYILLIFSLLSNLIALNVIAVLIVAYFLYLVYKASKVPTMVA